MAFFVLECRKSLDERKAIGLLRNEVCFDRFSVSAYIVSVVVANTY